MTRNISAASIAGMQARPPLPQRRLDAPQRFLLACGLLLIASGVFHGIVLLVTNGSFDGPLSWRKPLLFGLSFGITAVTIALVALPLRLRRSVSWLEVGVLILALLLLVGSGVATLAAVNWHKLQHLRLKTTRRLSYEMRL
ncbi:hypothetical protein [Enteractinococcus coprophilus]|nr:hypothetical protein [Enteractinococcus coprophilus]